ncbi:MAG: zinc ribbon domain-containing protein, partial [Clostridiales bacterium]|nr:zinc ribbon domain-containing protein [Clostridiales bacterium]
MFCVYCGTKLDDGSKFCCQCGKKQFDDTQQEETAQQLVQNDTIVMEESAVKGLEDNVHLDDVTNNLPINETLENKHIEISEENQEIQTEEKSEDTSNEDSVRESEEVSEEEIKEEMVQEVETKESVEEVETEAQGEVFVEEEPTIEVVEESVEKGQSAVFCAYCGVELETDALFCYNCGKAIVKVVEESEETQNIGHREEVESGAEEQEVVSAEEAVPTEESSEFCAYCGIELEEGAKFCYNCGNKIIREGEVPVEEPVQIKEEAPETEEAPAEESVQNEEEASMDEQTQAEEVVQVEEINQRDETVPLEETISDETVSVERENSHSIPLSVPQDTPKDEKKSKKSESEDTPKKSKKGMVKVIIAAGIGIVVLGGFGIFTKNTLDHLGDSAETFKAFIQENGLANVEEYTKLISDAENKANGFIVFGAGELEQKLEDATEECESLVTKLSDLRAKREEFENLGSKLLIDEEGQASIDTGLADLELALSNGDAAKAQEAIDSLTEAKTQIETDNKVYIESLLEEPRKYSNPDFTDEENEILQNQITLVEDLIENGDFVKAKEEALSCSVVILELEAKVEENKLNQQFEAASAKPEAVTIMISDSI